MRKVIVFSLFSLNILLNQLIFAEQDQLLAVVANQNITLQDIEEKEKGSFLRLKHQEYQVKQQALEATIVDKLFKLEAKAQKISLKALGEKEIDQKVDLVTDQEVETIYNQNAQQLKSKTKEEGLALVRGHLERGKWTQRRTQYIKTLKKKYSIKTYLEPFRISVDTDDDPVKGPSKAPVTIVEFSDFECGYCSQVTTTLKKILEKYKGQVRVVYRDFPLASHQRAPKAAEAATCAGKQGKFWEMHDMLFANQKALDVPSLEKYAEELGLKKKKFKKCLSSGKYQKEWKKDMEDGKSYGVSGTPAFFVNGRFFNGAQPFERFSEVIEDELERLSLNP